MNSQSRVQLNSTIVPVRFYLPELYSEIMGFTCKTHRGVLLLSKFALADDGTIFSTIAETQSEIATEDALIIMKYRMLYYHNIEELQTDPLRCALIMSIADQFSSVFESFIKCWPKTLNDMNEAMWATVLPRAQYAITWRRKKFNEILRLPPGGTELRLIRMNGPRKAVPLTVGRTQLTKRAEQYLNNTFNVAVAQAA